MQNPELFLFKESHFQEGLRQNFCDLSECLFAPESNTQPQISLF